MRAQYERKKKGIQLERYDQARTQAAKKESQDLTEQQLLEMILPSVEELKNRKGQIDMYKVKELLREKHQVFLSTWKAYNLKKLLEISHPELFEHVG